MSPTKKKTIAIIGGGASGIFASIRCAEVAKEKNIDVNICVFEATTSFLRKVRISGGGRCNVTHHLFDIKDFSLKYPRGQKELLSPLQKFHASNTIEWFENRGVPLKTEPDGRVFPVSNQSQSIIDCLESEAKKLGVDIIYQAAVSSLTKEGETWKIHFSKEPQEQLFDAVIIATGGSPKLQGFQWLKDLGHTIAPPLPSLFTFNIPKNTITELMGVAVENAKIKIKGHNIETEGALLITHWGMSGPAILKASAFGAPALAGCQYNFEIQVNWIGERNTELLFNRLLACALERVTPPCVAPPLWPYSSASFPHASIGQWGCLFPCRGDTRASLSPSWWPGLLL